MTQTSAGGDGPRTPDDVLITDESARRPARPPDYTRKHGVPSERMLVELTAAARAGTSSRLHPQDAWSLMERIRATPCPPPAANASTGRDDGGAAPHHPPATDASTRSGGEEWVEPPGPVREMLRERGAWREFAITHGLCPTCVRALYPEFVD